MKGGVIGRIKGGSTVEGPAGGATVGTAVGAVDAARRVWAMTAAGILAAASSV